MLVSAQAALHVVVGEVGGVELTCMHLYAVASRNVTTIGSTKTGGDL